MRKLLSHLRIFIPFIGIWILLVSCAIRPSLPPDYRLLNFEAEVEWQMGDLPIRALLTVCGATEDAPATLTSLRLLAPDTLEGIVLSMEDGKRTVHCHGLTADATLLQELWDTAGLVIPDGTILPVTTVERDGVSWLYAQIQSPQGEPLYECYLDPKSGVPKQIQHNDHILEIHTFTTSLRKGIV